MGARIPISSHLAGRVQELLHDPARWREFPEDVRQWLEVQQRKSRLPDPGSLLVESFPHQGRFYSVFYTFDGWPANQSIGMLLTRRMATQGLSPLGFVANDYALAVWGLKPVTDPAALLSPEILTDEFVAWVQDSYLLRRAFREVAVIAGLIERQIPGTRKTGRQVSFSTDLIYDVLRRYEPDHLLLDAAWADARARMTDVARVADTLVRAQQGLVHEVLEQVSPLAVPVLCMIGRRACLLAPPMMRCCWRPRNWPQSRWGRGDGVGA
jgi:ATP-dependent Lhr-like helicase